jgi:hypothetical protein
MNIISHRGNIIGPVASKENRPSYIDCALQLGYDVEVDIRFLNNRFWLGHDIPDYEVSYTWINLRKEKLWFHCKNIEAAHELQKLNNSKYFCHTADPYTITSTGHLWVHNLTVTLNTNCIIPLLTETDMQEFKYINYVYGVCTDYVKA